MIEDDSPHHGTPYGYERGCRRDCCHGPKSAQMAERYDAARELIAGFKAQPCLDCGGTFPQVCMEFDHRDPSTKLFNPAGSLSRSHKALLAEIAKCDVVCANCHALRTEVHMKAKAFTPGRPRKRS
jgi:hypothetical protein